jgi:hypothetical protein
MVPIERLTRRYAAPCGRLREAAGRGWLTRRGRAEGGGSGGGMLGCRMRRCRSVEHRSPRHPFRQNARKRGDSQEGGGQIPREDGLSSQAGGGGGHCRSTPGRCASGFRGELRWNSLSGRRSTQADARLQRLRRPRCTSSGICTTAALADAGCQRRRGPAARWRNVAVPSPQRSRSARWRNVAVPSPQRSRSARCR